MKRSAPLLLVLLLTATSSAIAQTAHDRAFTRNDGQWPSEVRFLAQLDGADAWITDAGIVFDFFSVAGPERKPDHALLSAGGRSIEPELMQRGEGHVLAMRFARGHGRTTASDEKRREEYRNYLLGPDSTRWRRHVPTYGEVTVQDIYPGIDARLTTEEGKLRYDFIVEAGADPAAIAIEFDGADGARIDDATGEIVVETSVGDIRHGRLLAYQEIAGERRIVACSFERRPDGTFGFAVGNFDKAYPLLIDPLVYSTYIGGWRSDGSGDIAVDRQGFIYIAVTTLSNNYPTTPGAYDRIHDSVIGGTLLSADIAVSKMNRTTNRLVYSTFIGGSHADKPKAITLDSDGRIYLAGVSDNRVGTTPFPVTANAVQSQPSGMIDIVVAVLEPAGDALSYASYLGGSLDDVASDIAIDGDGNIYVTGTTVSDNFPATIQIGNARTGMERVFATKLDPGIAQPVYTAIIGGNAPSIPTPLQRGFRIRPDAAGNAFVLGMTMSGSFPTTPGAYAPAFNGGENDMFLLKLDAAGTGLLHSTYLGGSDIETHLWGALVSIDAQPPFGGLHVAADGNVYVAGMTWSRDYPITADALQKQHGGVDDVFLTIVTPDLSTILYSTFVGGAFSDDVADLEMCADGIVCLVGSTDSRDFPMTPGVTEAPDVMNSRSYLAYVDPGSCPQLVYSTLIDKFQFKNFRTLAVAEDSLSACLVTSSPQSGFTVTDSPHNTADGGHDALIAMFTPEIRQPLRVKIEGDSLSCTSSAAETELRAVTSGGTEPYTFVWRAMGKNDTVTSNAFVLHPDPVARYVVAVIDSTGCEEISDTVTVALHDRISASFEEIPWACLDATVPFVVTELTGGPELLFRFAVRNADGEQSLPIRRAAETPLPFSELFTFRKNGIHVVTLVVWDPVTGCADTVEQGLVVRDSLSPAIQTASRTLCEGESTTLFLNESYDTYEWSTGETTPGITVTEPGVYTVYAEDRWGCVGTSEPITIELRPAPKPTIDPGDTVRICEGDSIELAATPGFAAYRWSNDATSQSIVVRDAGAYTVTVADDAGCEGRSDVTHVILLQRPATPTIVRRDDTLIASAAEGYQWFREQALIPGATERKLVTTVPGLYSVTVVSADGCAATGEPFRLSRPRSVRLDTVSGTVGQELRLTLYVHPPLEKSESADGFIAVLRVDPQTLFIHGALSPDYPAALDPLITRESAGSMLSLERETSNPVLADSILAYIDLEGLVTAQPVNTVEILSAVLSNGDTLDIAGHGLVLLDGCAISRRFGKRTRLVSVSPNPTDDGTLGLIYRAPEGIAPRLRLLDASGRMLYEEVLPAGTGEDLHAQVSLPAASGIYVLELYDRGEATSLPLIIKR